MTVSELIEALQTYPGDLEVCLKVINGRYLEAGSLFGITDGVRNVHSHLFEPGVRTADQNRERVVFLLEGAGVYGRQGRLADPPRN